LRLNNTNLRTIIPIAASLLASSRKAVKLSNTTLIDAALLYLGHLITATAQKFTWSGEFADEITNRREIGVI